jgi:peptidoglycan/LPS O-acetylase OafA/YrhL
MIYVGKRSYAVYLVNLICLSACVEVAHRIAPSVVFNSDNQPARHGAWTASILLLLAVTATSLLLSELLHWTIERPMIARGRIWSEQITGRKPVAPPRMTPETEARPVDAPAAEPDETRDDEAAVAATPPQSLKQPAPG